jgi:hypothetical protein
MSRVRSWTAGVLGALAVVAIVVASVAGTVHAVVLSPDAIATAVAPIGTSPQVRAAVATRAAAEIVDALDVEARAANLIGRPLGPLVAPSIAVGVENRLAAAIREVLASPAFEARWEQMVRATASVAIDVLRGDSALIASSDGVVYLNVLPAVAGTIDALEAQGLIDASVKLPDLSDPSTPAEQAIAMLSSALGLALPPDFGQVAVARIPEVRRVQGVVAALDRLTPLLIATAIGAAAAAVTLAVSRRRSTVRIGIGAAIIVALAPPLLALSEHIIVASISVPGMAIVASAFTGVLVDAVSWPLRGVAAACLAVALAGVLLDAGSRAGRRPNALLWLALGAAATTAVWTAAGPDATLLALALIIAGAWSAGRAPPSQVAA